jgi:hypothetical protein
VLPWCGAKETGGWMDLPMARRIQVCLKSLIDSSMAESTVP